VNSTARLMEEMLYHTYWASKIIIVKSPKESISDIKVILIKEFGTKYHGMSPQTNKLAPTGRNSCKTKIIRSNLNKIS